MAGNPISSAVGDIFGAIGDFSEAGAYSKAAKIANENAQISEQSTQIQETQQARALYQNLGTQVAAAGANGLSSSGGSAAAIMRSSMAQGALAKQLIGRQGVINENSFKTEAASYQGMASAANAAGIASAISAPLALFGL